MKEVQYWESCVNELRRLLNSSYTEKEEVIELTSLMDKKYGTHFNVSIKSSYGGYNCDDCELDELNECTPSVQFSCELHGTTHLYLYRMENKISNIELLQLLDKEEARVDQYETMYVGDESSLEEGDIILEHREEDSGYIGYDTNGYEMNEFNGPHSYFVIKRKPE